MSETRVMIWCLKTVFLGLRTVFSEILAQAVGGTGFMIVFTLHLVISHTVRRQQSVSTGEFTLDLLPN